MHDLFYRNPRLLQLVLALIVAGGISSFAVLPRTEDPRLTKRNSIIQTAYPGASAEQVEALVTEKLERRLEEIEEIYKLDSTSRGGASVIHIELFESVGEDAVDEIWSRIRDKVGEAQSELPPGALAPEFNEKDTEVDAYTVIAAFTWEEPVASPYGRMTSMIPASATRRWDVWRKPSRTGCGRSRARSRPKSMARPKRKSWWRSRPPGWSTWA